MLRLAKANTICDNAVAKVNQKSRKSAENLAHPRRMS
jgi:hypothetical protein